MVFLPPDFQPGVKSGSFVDGEKIITIHLVELIEVDTAYLELLCQVGVSHCAFTQIRSSLMSRKYAKQLKILIFNIPES